MGWVDQFTSTEGNGISVRVEDFEEYVRGTTA